MSDKKLVIEVLSPGDDGDSHGASVFHAVESFPVRIGRGYDNDIILSDVTVNAAHAVIDRRGDQLVAADLGSLNGTRLNGVTMTSAARPVSSGDRLRLGNVHVRLFVPGHPVPPAEKLTPPAPGFSSLNHPVRAWALFIMAVGAVTGWSYLNIWSDEVDLMLTSVAATAAAGLLIWAGVWAAVGRLMTRHARFSAQLSLISLFSVSGCFLWYATTYLAFWTSEGLLATGLDGIANALFMAVFLSAALSFGTNLTAYKRWRGALVFAAAITAGGFLINAIALQKFNPNPLYPVVLKPALVRLVPHVTTDAFVNETESVFGDNSFSKDKP